MDTAATPVLLANTAALELPLVLTAPQAHLTQCLAVVPACPAHRAHTRPSRAYLRRAPTSALPARITPSQEPLGQPTVHLVLAARMASQRVSPAGQLASRAQRDIGHPYVQGYADLAGAARTIFRYKRE